MNALQTFLSIAVILVSFSAQAGAEPIVNNNDPNLKQLKDGQDVAYVDTTDKGAQKETANKYDCPCNRSPIPLDGKTNGFSPASSDSGTSNGPKGFDSTIGH